MALLVVGCATGLAAAGAGLLELLKLSPEGPAMAVANHHMLMALTAWGLYAFSLLLRMEGMQPEPPGALALVLSGLGLVALCVTGWLGGKLVYVHGAGVVGQRH